MADKPPAYNPSYQSSYPPPPPPYEPVATHHPYPIAATHHPYSATPTPTVVTGIPQPGRSTTIVTGQNYGSIPQTSTRIVLQANPDVILVGGCPACRVGVLNEEFTLAGLCCAFWFFPIGLLCCLGMRERRCSNCHATFPV